MPLHGQKMASIDPATTIGTVELTVANLDRSSAFYCERLGFKLHRREGAIAALGAGGPDLLVLHENPAARHVGGTTGLYHFAVLLPSRRELALALRQIALTRTALSGVSDHLVSEALYLDDPDGNGIEVYRDRPRTEWPRTNGEIRMATDPLDLDGLLAEIEGYDEEWPGLPAETVIGHVHLHVGQIEAARQFYCDVLGFDLMQRYGGSALFVSAGGYHHHLGLNVWNGVGAPPPPANAAGLRHVVVQLPNETARNVVFERLQAANVSVEDHARGMLVRDPWQNGLLLAV